MQLKHRIKKAEQSLGINRSQYCACFGPEPLKCEVLPMTIDEWKRRADVGEETILPLPEKCADCGKPYDRRFIEESFDDVRAKVDERIRQAEETWRMHHE